eukprot:gnl/TRDRNA2_/TRDRNA2_66101_c0_seq2.p1 gnl/TRDRNA2_/TRDRNA2_66101_c0~~gnl/TRDRNA2_/TRDRNA2_66101_c0_seq2.p1  ORF type:complete len:294 (+),score=39.46 gnl/TRDRNA2_/TRDRNA2_66101_c0_seq2:112-993(+)
MVAALRPGRCQPLCAVRTALVLAATVLRSETAASEGFLSMLSQESLEDSVGHFAHDIEKNVVALSASPRIYQVDGFLSDEECDFLKQKAEPDLRQSLTINRTTGEYHPDSVRTNMQMYVTKEDTRTDPVISRIQRRLYRFARVPVGHGEQIQVGRYRVGEKYDCHYDSEVSVNVVRTATVIVYLQDVEEGGDTLFPMGKDCQPLGKCCGGPARDVTPPTMRFHPKKGRALLFFSHDLDGDLNPHALHCACPVVSGEKWIIQAWLRSTLYPESPHYVFGKAAEEALDSNDGKEL